MRSAPIVFAHARPNAWQAAVVVATVVGDQRRRRSAAALAEAAMLGGRFVEATGDATDGQHLESLLGGGRRSKVAIRGGRVTVSVTTPSRVRAPATRGRGRDSVTDREEREFFL